MARPLLSRVALRNCATLLVFLSVLSSSVRADLVFEKKEIEIKAGLSDKEAVARFHFKNTGSHPVHITRVRTTCGCTTAALDKHDYAPDEKGEIIATFDIGDRIGMHEKGIMLDTDQTTESVILLNLKIEIPDLLDVTPGLVYWQKGEKPVPKVILVKVLNGFEVKEIKAASSDPSVETRIEKVSTDQFKVFVSPKGAPVQTADALITVSAEYPAGTPRLFYARAKVR